MDLSRISDDNLLEALDAYISDSENCEGISCTSCPCRSTKARARNPDFSWMYTKRMELKPMYKCSTFPHWCKAEILRRGIESGLVEDLDEYKEPGDITNWTE